jgi:hypothetical protein
MVARGSSSQDFYKVAQAEYLDTLARRQDVAAGIEQSLAELNNAQMTLAKLKLAARFALQPEISGLELEITQQSIVYRSQLASATIINAGPYASPGAAPLAYELVRRAGGRVATYRVDGSCLLQPGDLVRVFPEDGKGLAEVVNRPPEAAPDRGANAAVRGPVMEQLHLLDFVAPIPTPDLSGALR